MSVYTCDEELPVYDQNVCDIYLLAAISAVAILKVGHGILDFTNPTEWQAAINAGYATIVREIKGGFESPTERTITNPRAKGPENIVTGWDMSLAIQDPNVNSTNDEFWGKTNVFSGELVWFNFEEQQIRVVNEIVRFISKPANSPIDGGVQIYDITANWRMKPDEYPVLYTAPAGIFE